MKYCKILLLCLLCLQLATSAPAKDKVTEKSGKKPSWIMTADQDWFTVFAQSDDLNEAQDKCLADIRQYIVNSIASNITSVERSFSESHNTDGNENIYSSYNSELKTAAAKMPFLTNISLSNATGTYWEKYKRKSDGTFYYIYHVQYPFTEAERNRLIREFVKYDNEMYGKLTALESEYQTLTDISEIDEGIKELQPLIRYFFDDVRKSEAESLLDTYRSAYSKISLVPESKELGRFEYSLMLDGRTLTYSKPPMLRSETATSLELRPEGDRYVLTYDYSLCYPTDDNAILISYSFPGTRLSFTLRFDVTEKDVNVIPSGIVVIDVIQDKDSTLLADVTLNLRSRTEQDFEVSDVTFTLPGIVEFKSDNTSTFIGSGRHIMHFRQRLESPVSSGRGMLTGTMKVSSGKNSETRTFTLPYKLVLNQ